MIKKKWKYEDATKLSIVQNKNQLEIKYQKYQVMDFFRDLMT